MFLAVVLCLSIVHVSFASDPLSCNFALEYTLTDVLENPDTRTQFMRDALRCEGNFMSPGVGSNFVSGLTYNGRPIDYTTGDIVQDKLWYWSASSKEALHLNVLAHAIQQNTLLTYPSKDEALDLLQKKIDSYWKFDAEYPGFGGFLPWFVATDDGLTPTDDFATRTPSLDNGQLIWSMIAASTALRNAQEFSVAASYDKYLAKLAQNALVLFYEGEGKFRTVANIKDVTAQPTRDNYFTSTPCGDPCYLDDPYEGELFTFFADLFADWSAFGGLQEREKVWEFKRAKLIAVDFDTPEGPITVQRGWWFSAHEQWKFLYLPYNTVSVVKRVQLNCERARTWNAHLNSLPGLFASVTEPCTPEQGNGCPFNYISATGIQSIAAQPVLRTDVGTPYGAFPVILANQSVGLAWYLNLLQAPGMQNPYGSTESLFLNGTGVCPCLTWDSKITTAVSMLGGVYELNFQALKEKSLFDRFYEVANREYSLAFPVIKGEDLPFQLPKTGVPRYIRGHS